MAKRTTPTTLTIDMLRTRGCHVEVVEHRHPFNRHVTIDLMGFADLLAFGPDKGITLVQATSNQQDGNHVKRRRKILAEPRALEWLRAGGHIMLVSWRQPVRNKQKTGEWIPRIEMFSVDDFAATAETEE